MANRKNTFLIKRSNTPGKVPTAGDLLLGELALNTADVILYASGTTANTILPIGWDRVARTGDTMTGALYVPYLNIKNFTGTTAVAGLAIDIDGNVITGSTFSSTFSGSTNSIPKFTSPTTLGDSLITDDGNFVTVNGATSGGDRNAYLNIISPSGFYYPSLRFFMDGSVYVGAITGYAGQLYINSGLIVHSTTIGLPNQTANTILCLNVNKYVVALNIGDGLTFTNGVGVSGGTLSLNRTPRVTSIVSSSTPTPNCDTDDVYKVTALATGATFGAPTGTALDGQLIEISIFDDGNAQTLAFNSSYQFSSYLTAPTTTIVGKYLKMQFEYDTSISKWNCMYWLNI